MPVGPHPHTPDSDGDCTRCPLPKDHPTHSAAPLTVTARDVRDLGVRHTPTQGATAAAAALAAWPRAGGTRFRVLESIAAAGDRGATDDELVEATGLGANTVRPRRGELKEGGFIVKATRPDGTPVQRPSAQGNPADVWVLSAAARSRRVTPRQDPAFTA